MLPSTTDLNQSLDYIDYDGDSQSNDRTYQDGFNQGVEPRSGDHGKIEGKHGQNHSCGDNIDNRKHRVEQVMEV